MVDYGLVGDIDLVSESVLMKLLDNGLMPVVSPLSADDKGTLLNINADTVAAAIGAALGAEINRPRVPSLGVTFCASNLRAAPLSTS